MANPARLSEFRTLYNRREIALWRLAGVVKDVLAFFEAQDFETAENQLRAARQEFDFADAQLNQFRNRANSNTGEINHGNRAA